MKRFDLLRVPKEIEIIGMDISELGGVSEDTYSKLRKDFGIFTPKGSPANSVYQRNMSSFPRPDPKKSINNQNDEADKESYDDSEYN